MKIMSILIIFCAIFCMAPAAPVSGGSSLQIEKMLWRERKQMLALRGVGAGPYQVVTVVDADSGSVIGSTTADRRGHFSFLGACSQSPPCRVEIQSTDGGAVMSDYTHGEPLVCEARWGSHQPSPDPHHLANRATEGKPAVYRP